MIELVRPSVDLAPSWWALVDAFDGATIHGSGLRPGDSERLRDPAVLGEWVDWLGRMERSDEGLPEGRVPSSYRWVLDDGRVVGTIAIRHALTPSLLAEGGHIGYAVRPGDRGRGVASSALSLALDLAHRRGIDPALVTCDVDNLASARTIEHAIRARGGFLEDVHDGIRRYWVRTDSGPVGGA
ncbi:MAG TPA: GNAT family N-acetyltransferase [Humibacillus xanthopallidus]|nr:GNAT family N-acetyltransferase [Humibacillus xanthopallidus]